MQQLKLENLTTEQKLGMLYCSRCNTDENLEYTVELIKKHALGSVQIAPHKKEYMRRVREAADYPLLIICDTESGFPGSEKQPMSLMALSACNKPEFFEVFAKAIVTEARAAGYNGTWGPVVDVLNCNSPCSVFRHFSDDPDRVGKGAEVMCKVYARNGYMSCGKHYPGGCDKPFDDHMAPTSSGCTAEMLKERDLRPYQYLMDRDLLPSIMTSHRVFEQIDPDNSGTISPKVQGLIRDMGWNGVCFTDSFAMLSVLQKYGEEKVLGLAIAAGNDIVLPNYRTRTEDSFHHLMQNYADGIFSEERLNESAKRVIDLQNRLAQIPEAVDVFTAEDQILYDSIAKECVTAVTDAGLSPALDPNKSKLFIILTDNSFAVDKDAMETATSEWYRPHRIAEKIKEIYPDAGIEFLPEFPSHNDNQRVLVASTEYDETIFVSFCVTNAYLGTDGLTRRAEAVINALSLTGNLTALLHFGNPFAVEELFHIPRIVFGYDIPDAQLYAIDVLAGTIPANGTLPFKVNLK